MSTIAGMLATSDECIIASIRYTGLVVAASSAADSAFSPRAAESFALASMICGSRPMFWAELMIRYG